MESLEILFQRRAKRASPYLREGCPDRLDPGLGGGQALAEVLREALHDALDLGNRRRVYSEAGGQVGDDAPVVEGDHPARGRDVPALVLDQADELLVCASDGGGDEILNLWRGERPLCHVGG